jgi:hypothetical protein
VVLYQHRSIARGCCISQIDGRSVANRKSMLQIQDADGLVNIAWIGMSESDILFKCLILEARVWRPTFLRRTAG